MVTIELFEHPLAPVAPRRFEAGCVGEWLLAHYGDRLRHVIQVFRGQPAADTEITNDLPALLQTEGHYTVLQSPGGDWLPALNPYVWLSKVGLEWTVQQLLPAPPTLPSNVNRTQQSQNNALGNRENKARILERIEDIYGTVRAIPSLLMPTYSKYVSHLEYEHSYMCVGRGYYAIEDVRDGDTLLSDIDGASAEFYDPFTSPNSGSPVLSIGGDITDPVLTVSRSNNVDGTTLLAPNQANLPASASYTFKTAAAAGASGDRIIQASTNPSFASVLTAGDSVTVAAGNLTFTLISGGTVSASSVDNSFSATGIGTGVQVGDTITTSGFSNAGNNGSFTVLTVAANKITVTATLVSEASASPVTVTHTVNYDGTYTVASVIADNEIELTTATFAHTISHSAAVSKVGSSEWTSWITLKASDMDQVWCNILATGGMFKDDGSGKKTASVDYEIQVEQLDNAYDPTGTVITETGTVSGKTSTQRAITHEISLTWTGPARVRMRRSSDYSYGYSGTIVDEIKWADLYAVSPVSETDFGNVTTVMVVTKATQRALSVKQRQFNCRATRKLPTYDGSSFSGALAEDGSIATGAISATNRFIDILAAVAVDPKIGRRTLATDVDISQIWGVYQDVAAWSPLCAEFSYTLDSDNLSFEETVNLIADACFCMAYRQNGKIRFAFDQAQASSTMLLTHRNKRPAADTITRKFAADADYDGIELVYNDNVSDQSETIKLPLDGSAGKYQKLEIAGIRNYEQAWYRANREYNKLTQQRISIETETTADGRLLLPNTRIDIVDNTRFDAMDGEVVGQNGLELTLSRDVSFSAGAHSIVLMKRDGSLQSITCTAGSSANRVILESLPGESVVTTPGEDGIRTIFSFAADAARDAMAYLVQEIEIQDQSYVKVRAINYDDGYYAADTETVPDRSTVL